MYDWRYKSHFADGEKPVLPQRWAIIIDAVTILECHWASSRIASHIYIVSHALRFSRQILVGDCRQSTVNFDV